MCYKSYPSQRGVACDTVLLWRSACAMPTLQLMMSVVRCSGASEQRNVVVQCCRAMLNYIHDVTAAIARCDCSYHTMCAIHDATYHSYHAMYRSYRVMGRSNGAMCHSYRVMRVIHRAM